MDKETLKKNNRKIIDLLLEIVENDENLLPLEELDDTNEINFFMRNFTSIKLNETIRNNINEICKLIIKDDYIKKNIATYNIEEKIKDIITLSFELKRNKREKFVTETILNLRNEFKSKIKENIIQIPIYNLEIDEEIKIGPVRFFTLSEKDFNSLNINKEEKEILYKIHFEPNIGKTLAEVEVSGSKEIIKNKAISKINLAINSLKIFLPIEMAHFKIKGEYPEKIKRVYYQYDKNKKLEYSKGEFIGLKFPTKLIKKDFYEIPEFQKLSILLKKRKFNEFDQLLLKSILWFGEGLSIYDHEEKYLSMEHTYKHESFSYFKWGNGFLKMFTSLETVLIGYKEEKISKNLGERAALLCEKGTDFQMKIENYYDIRSNIIHNGDFFVSKKDFNDLINIVRTILIKLIDLNDKKNFKKFKNFKEYLNKINEKQLNKKSSLNNS